MPEACSQCFGLALHIQSQDTTDAGQSVLDERNRAFETLRAIAVDGLGLPDPWAWDASDSAPQSWLGLMSEKVARLRKDYKEACATAGERLKHMLNQQDINDRAINEWRESFRRMKSERDELSQSLAVARIACDDWAEADKENARKTLIVMAELDHWKRVSGFENPEEMVDSVNGRFKAELPKGLAKELWKLEERDRKKAETDLSALTKAVQSYRDSWESGHSGNDRAAARQSLWAAIESRDKQS